MGWPSTTVSVLAYDLAAVVSICLRLRLAQTREMLRGKVKNRGNSLGRGGTVAQLVRLRGAGCRLVSLLPSFFFFFFFFFFPFSSELPFVSVF